MKAPAAGWVRPATAEDLPAINAIYNHYVEASTCTYQTEPDSLESRRAWFSEHGAAHPVIVVERSGVVVAWGSLSPFRRRSAYRFTVEDSTYVRHDLQGQGLGSLVLVNLIQRAREAGHHTVIAGISADQTPSLRLHQKFGFTPVAHLKEVGFKFGQWLDVVYLQLLL